MTTRRLAWMGGRAVFARHLLVLGMLTGLPAHGYGAEAATNPASDDLNRTTDAMAGAPHALGLLSRERPRLSQVIGAPLLNETGMTLGTVADVILAQNGAMAIIETGQHLVSIPFGDLRSQGGRLVLPAMTMDALRARPAFRFNDPVR